RAARHRHLRARRLLLQLSQPAVQGPDADHRAHPEPDGAQPALRRRPAHAGRGLRQPVPVPAAQARRVERQARRAVGECADPGERRDGCQLALTTDKKREEEATVKASLFYLPTIASRPEIERGMAGMSGEYYQRMLRELSEQIRLADDLGYDSVSFTEHHF